MISHGTIHTLEDLCKRAPSLHNQSVRVIGRLDAYDATAARATIKTREEARMVVDVSKVPGGDPHRVGSLYQYIGEVDSSGGGGEVAGEHPVVLRARVARCVDGLDVNVYTIALRERERFLGEHNPRRNKSQPPPKS